MSSEFSSRRSAASSVGFALTSALVSALVFSGTGCLKAHIFLTHDGGTGGSVTGTGGGTGGDNSGVGGDEGLGGDIGTGEGGAGEGGAGGEGTGGTPGTGGSPPDAGYDGPGTTPNMPGQLVITEIMVNPNAAADDVGEWFEVYNPSTTDTMDMFGCVLLDSSNSNQDYILNHSVVIGPRAFATFGRFGDAITGGFVPTFDYHVVSASTTDVKFGNSGDAVKVRCNGVFIDIVDFGAPPTPVWFIPQGATLSLDPAHYDATENDLQSNWCPSPSSSYHGGDLGSPGVTNPPCPRG